MLSTRTNFGTWRAGMLWLLVLLCAPPTTAQTASAPTSFPIAVWLQAPKNVERFKAIGINTYVGLWEGPTEAQLAELKQAGMNVICAQNEVGLKHLADKTIVGWMHGDEPDNAQPVLGISRWGSPIPAEKVVADYKRIKANDPSRPVLLNVGHESRGTAR